MSLTLPILTARAPAAPTVHPDRLIDSYGRTIRDLRLSLTDRCNFRCRYCMEPDVRYMRRMHMLTDAEILRLVRVMMGLGVRRVRLTGGEPTLHPTLPELIGDLGRLGLDDLSMTTNGSVASLDDFRRWRRDGLRRVTVSLDSLRPDRFEQMTRSGSSPGRVLRALRDAKEAGLGPVKLNAVVMRGFNDDELPDFAALARDLDIDVRLIEYMPLDSAHRWSMGLVVTADEMLERIEGAFPLESGTRERASTPAKSYRFADGAPGRIGVIASVTRPFCGACSRLRITADGKVMPCLFSRDEYDVRALLRDDPDDEQIARFLAGVTWSKQSGHRIARDGFLQPDRPMSAIGG